MRRRRGQRLRSRPRKWRRDPRPSLNSPFCQNPLQSRWRPTKPPDHSAFNSPVPFEPGDCLQGWRCSHLPSFTAPRSGGRIWMFPTSAACLDGRDPFEPRQRASPASGSRLPPLGIIWAAIDLVQRGDEPPVVQSLGAMNEGTKDFKQNRRIDLRRPEPAPFVGVTLAKPLLAVRNKGRVR
ncbi:hypothetical protein FHS26_004779 [Rhizobium pisi]|uniref:Uncharacterized protein n=1 Tax=Rhizobium pisi TaxID=574561 RepID=A0A7W5BQ23_9HYPH|nr:hypothetical protein [Rhizobium pisi]